MDTLKQQLSFLESSCKAFDEGNEGEALRIAVVIRTLVHDTPNSKSLLEQLGLKSSIKFIDSADPIDPVPTKELYKGRQLMALSGMPGLFAVSMSTQGAKLLPRLEMAMNARGAVSFDDWWVSGCIPGENGARHSRSWLIKQMANKEGGAHVDPEINRLYSQLKQTTMGMTVIAGNVSGFTNSPADVSVRQVAWELVKSLQDAQAIT